MKPFDLKLAKAGHPVQTANGAGARIICFDRDSEYNVDERYPIVALVRVAGIEKIVEYTKKGVARQTGFRDLVMVTVKKEGWVNVFGCASKFGAEVGPPIHDTKESAESCGRLHDNYITTIKIEYET